ncbi:hypothetical protein OIY81_1488 [Cryptosporidium canis]|nr:hypothetical protein OIY81_1488 [Cryptosporidium canis]
MRLTNEETEEFQRSFAPVSYGHLSRQLVEHSYSEFLDLLGRFTSDPNVQEEAKTCLWEYSAEVREVFLRMLAIGSLSRIIGDINKAIQLRETLVSIRFKQRKLAYDFYPALTLLGTPSPNVPSAIDMILLKDFSRMPNLLEELVSQYGRPMIVPKMSETQKSLIEKQLRDDFFIKYASSSIAKTRMVCFDVVNGRIQLDKKSRFSLTLISDLKQWQVIDARITVPEILSVYTVTREQNHSFKEILQAKIYYMFNCKDSEEREIGGNQDYELRADVLGELYKTANVITGEVILEMLLEQSILNIKEQGIAGIYHSEKSEYKYNSETYKYIDVHLYKNVDITNLTKSSDEMGSFNFERYSLAGAGQSKSLNSVQTVSRGISYSKSGASFILRFLMVPNGDIKCILWPFSLLFSRRDELSRDVNSVLDKLSTNESWLYLCNWEKTNHDNILDLSKILNHVSNVLRCYLLELYSLKLRRFLSKNATVENDVYSITIRLLDYSEYVVSLDIFTGSLLIRDANIGRNSIWRSYPSYYENLKKALKSNTNSLFHLLPCLLKLTRFQIIRDGLSSNYNWRPISSIPESIQDSIWTEKELREKETNEIKSEENTDGTVDRVDIPSGRMLSNSSSVIVNTVIDNMTSITNCMIKRVEKNSYISSPKESNDFDYFFYPKQAPDNSRTIYIQIDSKSCDVKVFKVFFTKNCKYVEDIDKVLLENNRVYRLLGTNNFDNSNKCDYNKGKVILAEFNLNIHSSINNNHLVKDEQGAKDTLGGKCDKLHAQGLQIDNVVHADDIGDREYALEYVGFDYNGLKDSFERVFEDYSENFETRHSEIIEFLELLQDSAGESYFPFRLYSGSDGGGCLEPTGSNSGVGIKEYGLFFQPYKDSEREQYLSSVQQGFSSDRARFKMQVFRVGAGKSPVLSSSSECSGVQRERGLSYRLVMETNQRGSSGSTLFMNGNLPVPLMCTSSCRGEAFTFDRGFKIEFSICDMADPVKQEFPREFGLVETISLAAESCVMAREGFIQLFIDCWHRLLRFLHKLLETMYMVYYSKPSYSLNSTTEMEPRRDFLIQRILPWEIELHILPWSLLFGDSLSSQLFQMLDYKGGFVNIRLLGVVDGSASQDSDVIELQRGRDHPDSLNGQVSDSHQNEGSDHSEIIHSNEATQLMERSLVVVEINDQLLSSFHSEIYKRDLLYSFNEEEPILLLGKAYWSILKSYEVSISVSIIESKQAPRIQEILLNDIHGFYDSLNTLSAKRIDGIGKFLLSFGLRKVGMQILFLFELDPVVHYKLKISLFDVQNIQLSGTSTKQPVEVINHTRKLLDEFIRVISCRILNLGEIGPDEMTLLSLNDPNNFERLQHIRRTIGSYQSPCHTHGEVYYYPGYFFQRILCSLSQFFTSSFYVSIASGVTQRKLNNMMSYLAKSSEGNGGSSVPQLKQPILNWAGGGSSQNNEGINTAIQNKTRLSKFDTFPIKQPIIEFTWFYNKVASFDVDRKHILSFNKKWGRPAKYHKIPEFISYMLPPMEEVQTRPKDTDSSKSKSSSNEVNPSDSSKSLNKGGDSKDGTGNDSKPRDEAASKVSCSGGIRKLHLDSKDANINDICVWPLEYDIPFFVTAGLDGLRSSRSITYAGAIEKRENKRSFSEYEQLHQLKQDTHGLVDSSSNPGSQDDCEQGSHENGNAKRKRLNEAEGLEGGDSVSVEKTDLGLSSKSPPKTRSSGASYPEFPLVCFPDIVRSETNHENIMIMDMSYSLELFTSPISSEFDILDQTLQSFGNLSQSRTLVRIVTIALCSSLMVIRDISVILKYPLLSMQGKLPVSIDLICQYDDLLVPIEREERTYCLRGVLYRVWRSNKIKEYNSIITTRQDPNLNTEKSLDQDCSHVDIYLAVRNIPVKSVDDIEINGCKASQIFSSFMQQNISHMSILSSILDRLFNSPFEELKKFHSPNSIQLLDILKPDAAPTPPVGSDGSAGLGANMGVNQQSSPENPVNSKMNYASSTPLTASPMSSPAFGPSNYPRGATGQIQGMNTMGGGLNYSASSSSQIPINNLAGESNSSYHMIPPVNQVPYNNSVTQVQHQQYQNSSMQYQLSSPTTTAAISSAVPTTATILQPKRSKPPDFEFSTNEL